MSKQYSQYFKGVIEELMIEPKPYLERVSFWRTIERTRNEYFMLCSLSNAKEDFKLKIKISDNDFNKSKIGDNVSIHLTFSYDYACFHYPEEKKENILEMEKRY